MGRVRGKPSHRVGRRNGRNLVHQNECGCGKLVCRRAGSQRCHQPRGTVQDAADIPQARKQIYLLARRAAVIAGDREVPVEVGEYVVAYRVSLTRYHQVEQRSRCASIAADARRKQVHSRPGNRLLAAVDGASQGHARRCRIGGPARAPPSPGAAAWFIPSSELAEHPASPARAQTTAVSPSRRRFPRHGRFRGNLPSWDTDLPGRPRQQI